MIRISVLLSSILLLSCGGDTPNNPTDVGDSQEPATSAAYSEGELETGRPIAGIDKATQTAEKYDGISVPVSTSDNTNQSLENGYSHLQFYTRPENLVEEIKELNQIVIAYGHASGFFSRETNYFYPDSEPLVNTENAASDISSFSPDPLPEEYCEAFQFRHPDINESFRFPEWQHNAAASQTGPARSVYERLEETFDVGNSIKVLANGQPYLSIPSIPSVGSEYYLSGVNLPDAPLSVELVTPLHIDAKNFDFPLVKNVIINDSISTDAWRAGEAITWNPSQDPNTTMEIMFSSEIPANSPVSISFSCSVKDDGHFVIPAEIIQYTKDWPVANEWLFTRDGRSEVIVGDATYRVILTTQTTRQP